jgi:hypothetical protein
MRRFIRSERFAVAGAYDRGPADRFTLDRHKRALVAAATFRSADVASTQELMLLQRKMSPLRPENASSGFLKKAV